MRLVVGQSREENPTTDLGNTEYTSSNERRIFYHMEACTAFKNLKSRYTFILTHEACSGQNTQVELNLVEGITLMNFTSLENFFVHEREQGVKKKKGLSI